MNCIVPSYIVHSVLQYGRTALMIACQWGCIDVVRHLVRRGKSSVNARADVSVQ